VDSGYPDRGPVYLPLVDVALRANGRTCGAKGLLDIGSSFTIFGTTYADVLRIKWTDGARTKIVSVSGQLVTGYVCDAELITHSCSALVARSGLLLS
jgi:hypothetical protein